MAEFWLKITEWWQGIKEQFIANFIDDNYWKFLVEGLGRTLLIAFFAALMGIVIGIVIAAVRSTYDMNKESMSRRRNFSYYALSFVDRLCKLYLTVIRGTPVVVQLLLAYFVIFASSDNSTLVAILAFGINSGAYVAEILRGGIMAIDRGQFEAGRSLGLNYIQTMIYIIIPQVFKSTLPTLLNEFIALLKETSVAGYVGIVDLTKAGNIIRGNTFSAFMPLIAVALIYLVIVIIMTRIVSVIEKKLRKSER